MIRRTRLLASCVALLGAWAAAAQAATFTVTNTGTGSGSGTLRRAVTSANSTAGADTIRFQIPTSDAGYSASRGVFTIRLTTAVAAITESVVIDGTTQTAFTGDTNAGQLGAGGVVGTGALALPRVNRPEIEIVDGNGLAIGFDIDANNVTIRGLAIYGFGNAANSDNDTDIRVRNGRTGALIEQNILGSTASNFVDPGTSARSGGDHIRVTGGDSGIIRRNLIGFSQGKGIELNSGANGWLVESNEIRTNGYTAGNWDGIDIENGTNTATIRGNLLTGNFGCGIDAYQSTGSSLIENNTIENNGFGTIALIETMGVRLFGTGNTAQFNVIRSNRGAGIVIAQSSRTNRISQNSIYANGASTGQIGIDLHNPTDNEATGTAPFVTLNDTGDPDAGGNDLTNFPVLVSASLSAGQFTLRGFARPGATIELFLAAADPSGFGEGQLYLRTFVEGSAQDLDTGTGSYSGPINGINQGSDTTNRFTFTVAAPAGVVSGVTLTATATVGGSTSEFSGVVAVTNAAAPAQITLLKSVAPGGPQLPGTNLAYTVQFTNGGGSAASGITLVDAIPASTDFQLGSAAAALGTTGLTVTIQYSNTGGASWTYTPTSGGGGAPAGYDRQVTHLRWVLAGSLSHLAPNNTGSASFTVRVR